MTIKNTFRNLLNILDDLAITADINIAEAAIEARANKEATAEYHKQLLLLLADKTFTPLQRTEELLTLKKRYKK